MDTTIMMMTKVTIPVAMTVAMMATMMIIIGILGMTITFMTG